MKKIISSILVTTSLLIAQDFKSDANDQFNLSLTVYNNNRAVVSEKRKLNFPKGLFNLQYGDVSAQIMPETIIVENLGKTKILEQNYEYDLISYSKILEKYVGKELNIVLENEYSGKKELKKAKLLSMNGGPVFEIDGKILLGNFNKFELPKLPDNLYAKPTINWLVQNLKSEKKEISLSYLTSGLTWEANYVLNLSDDEKTANLMGWVTMNNKSGTTYKDAKLKLVAGNVNQVQPEQVPYSNRNQMSKSSMLMESEEMIEEKSFFEYHLYTVPRKVSINNNQEKQISLLSAENVKINKRYVANINYHSYSYSSSSVDGFDENPVKVSILFKTSKSNNINSPIPKGVVRLYKKDSDGGAILIGEDRVQHTPINEMVSLNTGDAFDIKVKSKQTKFESVSKKIKRMSYKIEVKNHKTESVTVELKLPVWGNWKMIKSPKYRKLNAQTIIFDVEVPASASKTLEYTLETRR